MKLNRLSDINAAIKTHYPKDPPQIAMIPFTSSDRTALIAELSEGKYSFASTTPLIKMVDDRLAKISYPGRLTIRCLQLDQVYVPLHKLKRVAKRILCILDIFAVAAHVDIWFVPDPSERLVPGRPAAPIMPQHINGGYTYFNKHTIFVYRLEEFPKVMLHEVLHNTPINASAGPAWSATEVERLSRALLGPKTTVMVDANEAIVETWAEVFQALFIAFENGIPAKDVLEVERAWGENQAAKLYAHFGYSLSNNPNKWKEETNAFSYTVLRSILMRNLDAFLKLERPYKSEDFIDFVAHYLPCFKCKKSTNKYKRSLRISWFGDL